MKVDSLYVIGATLLQICQRLLATLWQIRQKVLANLKANVLQDVRGYW
jgi:hypothetical protein